MLVGLLSDAHGDVVSLQRAAAWLRSRVEAVVFAGDAFSDHCFSNDVVDILRDLDATYVLGNHELSLLGLGGARARGAEDVRPDLLEYVASRPTSCRLDVGGVRVLVVHASPWPPHDEYLVPGHRALRRTGELDVDVLVLGHAHVPFATWVGSTLVVNPGSIGTPAGDDGRWFAVLDTAGPAVEHHRLDRDGSISARVPP